MRLLFFIAVAIFMFLALATGLQYLHFYLMGKALTAGYRSEITVEKQPTEYSAYQLDSMLQRQKKIESELSFYK